MGIQVGDSKGGVMVDMNVVPLIDVLLVLLIIFMVITPLTPKGLEALVPQPSPPGAQASEELLAKTIVVQIGADGSVKINEEPSSWENLGPRLEQIFAQRAERVAFVKGDENVIFAEVARAIDIMRSSGIEKVGLITAKIEAGQ
ncbi:MAG: biopolymer transporter ExbD [Firmicutes bacterium]|nr:biopolymer transporter ExbD [Bacillota bacterium]